MLKIRSNVFETNSSSTHSISINSIGNDFQYNEIPKNTDILIVDFTKNFEECGSNFTEWTKLNFLIYLICKVKECARDDGIDDVMNYSNKLLTILKKIIRKECHSNLIFDENYLFKHDDFFYFDCDEYLWTILDLDKYSSDDEIEEKLKDIIFNKNKYIKDDYKEW